MSALSSNGPALPYRRLETDDRILAWPQVRDWTGISRTTAWRMQKAGDFPGPVQITPGRVGWRESELLAWRASRVSRDTMRLHSKTDAPTPIVAEPIEGAGIGQPVLLTTEPRPARASGSEADRNGPGPVRSARARRRPAAAAPGQIAFEF